MPVSEVFRIFFDNACLSVCFAGALDFATCTRFFERGSLEYVVDKPFHTVFIDRAMPTYKQPKINLMNQKLDLQKN